MRIAPFGAGFVVVSRRLLGSSVPVKEDAKHKNIQDTWNNNNYYYYYYYDYYKL